MKAGKKMTNLKRVLALAAVLAMTGTAMAKKPAPGVPGDLSPDRTSATVTVTVQCDSAIETATLSVYIFQPSGRLLNIGIGNPPVTCTNPAIDQEIVVTVNAIQGLAFKPGPATLLTRLTTVNTTTLEQTVSESGFRVDLHP